MTRWAEDSIKVDHAVDVLREMYEDPVWGLKASEEDAVTTVARRVCGVTIDRPESSELGTRLWDWVCETPSPLAEGLSDLVAGGLRPGAAVPVAEIAGEADTVDWELRRARFILELVEGHARGVSS